MCMRYVDGNLSTQLTAHPLQYVLEFDTVPIIVYELVCVGSIPIRNS